MQVATVYKHVVAKKCSNKMGAKCPLETGLNIEAWENYSTGHERDQMFIDGIRYGFSLQYIGGPIYNGVGQCGQPPFSASIPRSCTKLYRQRNKLGALVGPFDELPFRPWCKVSPLMSRPKSGSDDRRIIVDLSLPDGGVNADINKNVFEGMMVEHKLPTVHQAVDKICTVGVDNTILSTIDKSRAYKNFTVCPADWPLLVITYDDMYYFQAALPFGGKMSSWFMPHCNKRELTA